MLSNYDDEMSDEDPRTGTQLVNNESLAQCSQDSETNISMAFITGNARQTEVG